MNNPPRKSIPLYIDISLNELKTLKRGYPGAAQEIAKFLTRNGIATDAQASKNFHGTWKAAAKILHEEATQLFGGVQILNPKYPFKGKPGAARRYYLEWYWRLVPLVEKTKAKLQKQGMRHSNEDAIRRILAQPCLRKYQVYEDQWIKQYACHNAAFHRAQKYAGLSSPSATAQSHHPVSPDGNVDAALVLFISSSASKNC